ncbi:hypothetical protein GWK18_11790 [Kocuria sp. JC486]|uniref:LysR substrate-binding domain-containing protein n=1 Tax=Kocuria sp. JC486 TaxID=1970736 RepID=UPI001423F3B7|nr:LysR substrate-binding domain-containing protein [Kocuria sp. JC486]NHU86246.1 hypothetical protein [Kocuria sp. JC486]
MTESTEQTSGPLLRVGYEPGMMPGKWFDRWRERLPGATLVDEQLEPGRWRTALGTGIDACLVRLPAHPKPGLEDLEGLRGHFRAVPAYTELQVVVLPAEHELTLLDEVPVAELADEYLVQDLPEHRPSQHGAGTDDDGAPRPPLEARDDADLVEYVAAGIGLVVLPMSVARFHHRKDLTYRVVPDLPGSDVVVVWPQDLPEETEALVQDLVGVVRGRKRDSSRGEATHLVTENAQDSAKDAVAPRKRRQSAKAKPGTTKAKPGESPSRTAKGTSRGDQLKGKRLAGGKARRGAKPGRPSTRGGGGRKHR